MFSDSDWGGRRGSRKSTSGGCILLGKHCIKTWSSTQGAVALSSAEAEFYAMVDGVQKAKWAATLATELGVQVSGKVVEVKTDSDAARSFENRRGLGRMFGAPEALRAGRRQRPAGFWDRVLPEATRKANQMLKIRRPRNSRIGLPLKRQQLNIFIYFLKCFVF